MNVSFDENTAPRPVVGLKRLTLGERLSKASNGALSVGQARYVLLGAALIMFMTSIWLMIPQRANTVDTVTNMPGERP